MHQQPFEAPPRPNRFSRAGQQSAVRGRTVTATGGSTTGGSTTGGSTTGGSATEGVEHGGHVLVAVPGRGGLAVLPVHRLHQRGVGAAGPHGVGDQGGVLDRAVHRERRLPPSRKDRIALDV